MGVLDLDAAREARAAKAEAKAEPHVILLNGQKFEIAAEMPAEFAFAFMEGKPRDGLRVLFGEHYDEFAKTAYSIDDLVELVEGVAELYGFDNLGEALASRESSRSNGKRARPTSKRTTG